MARKKASQEVANYEFRAGGNVTAHGVSAEDVVQSLEQIKSNHGGRLETEAVVAAASHKDHTLHPFFTWDDSEAAQAHRLWQARSLISSVRITYSTETSEEPRRVSAFVNIRDANKPHYVSTMDAMSNDNQRKLVVRRAWEELAAFRRRYAELQEFAGLFDIVDEIGGLVDGAKP